MPVMLGAPFGGAEDGATSDNEPAAARIHDARVLQAPSFSARRSSTAATAPPSRTATAPTN